MAKKTYQAGDQVRLRSGGPVMTIKNPASKLGGQAAPIQCQWFGGKKLEEGHFAPDSLELVDEEEGE